MKDSKIKITVPHSIDYLPISLNTVCTIAKLAGFDMEDISKLETATEEAVSNVIRFAYNKSDDSTFDVIIEKQTMGLLISIKEAVALHNSSVGEQDFSLKVLKPNSEFKALSYVLIKQLMDKVWFHSYGKNGLETSFFKYLKKYNLHVASSGERQVSKGEETEQLQKKTDSYTVRRMRPEESIEVSRVAYSSYGNTYLHSDIYYPDRIRELNSKNQLMSFIAVTEGNEVIAHLAFERSTDKSIPEIGVAFTKPTYRGIGCLNKLMVDTLDEAEKLSFKGIFAQGVTSHPYSQKSLYKFNFRDCGLLLSIFHELSMEDIEQKKLQRESVVVSFRYLIPPEKMAIYPPEHHAEMITNLYQNIGFIPEIRKPNLTLTTDVKKSILTVKTDNDNQTADITVSTIGENVLTEVSRILNTLCHNNTATIYLRMRLTDKNTATCIIEFEKMGFFFSGILPRSANKDELVLQYLNNYAIDFNLLKIDSDNGKEILEYVKKCV